MFKLLVFTGLLVSVYYLFFKKKAITHTSSDNSQEEAMVPCAQCGTYVQIKETFMREGKYYCSRECLEH